MIISIVRGEFTVNEIAELLTCHFCVYNWEIKKFFHEFKFIFPSFNLALDAAMRKQTKTLGKSINLRFWNLNEGKTDRNLNSRVWLRLINLSELCW